MLKYIFCCRNATIALKKLLDCGCETVIITLGVEGAVYSSKKDDEPIHVLCDQVKAIDTTVCYYV